MNLDSTGNTTFRIIGHVAGGFRRPLDPFKNWRARPLDPLMGPGHRALRVLSLRPSVLRDKARCGGWSPNCCGQRWTAVARGGLPQPEVPLDCCSGGELLQGIARRLRGRRWVPQTRGERPDGSPASRGKRPSDAPGRAGSAAAAGAPSRRASPTAAAAAVGAGSGALPLRQLRRDAVTICRLDGNSLQE